MIDHAGWRRWVKHIIADKGVILAVDLLMIYGWQKKEAQDIVRRLSQ